MGISFAVGDFVRLARPVRRGFIEPSFRIQSIDGDVVKLALLSGADASWVLRGREPVRQADIVPYAASYQDLLGVYYDVVIGAVNESRASDIHPEKAVRKFTRFRRADAESQRLMLEAVGRLHDEPVTSREEMLAWLAEHGPAEKSEDAPQSDDFMPGARFIVGPVEWAPKADVGMWEVFGNRVGDPDDPSISFRKVMKDGSVRKEGYRSHHLSWLRKNAFVVPAVAKPADYRDELSGLVPLPNVEPPGYISLNRLQELEEGLAKAKVLFRSPGKLYLWAIPYEMPSGKTPSDLWHADKRKDWVWLGTDTWRGGMSEDEVALVERFLARHAGDVPAHPAEWSRIGHGVVVTPTKKVTGAMAKTTKAPSELTRFSSPRKASKPKKASSKKPSASFNECELAAMCIMTGFKAFARPKLFESAELGEYTPTNPIIAKFLRRGLLKISRSGTITPDPKLMKAEMKLHQRPDYWRCSARDFAPTEGSGAKKASPKKASPKKPSAPFRDPGKYTFAPAGYVWSPGAVPFLDTNSLEDWYPGQPNSTIRRVRIEEIYDFDGKQRVSVTVLEGPETGRKVTGLSPSNLQVFRVNTPPARTDAAPTIDLDDVFSESTTLRRPEVKEKFKSQVKEWFSENEEISEQSAKLIFFGGLGAVFRATGLVDAINGGVFEKVAYKSGKLRLTEAGKALVGLAPKPGARSKASSDFTGRFYRNAAQQQEAANAARERQSRKSRKKPRPRAVPSMIILPSALGDEAMHHQKGLKLIGFWGDVDQPNLPDPHDYVDCSWDASERDAVIKHLESGQWAFSARGVAGCRICGRPRGGNSEMSDGTYLWPSGFVHYLREHCVKPPREFIDHVLGKNAQPSLHITDAGAFGKLSSIEGGAWTRRQKAGGVKLDNSFALNLAAYDTMLEQGLGGLDVPLSELDAKAGVILGSEGTAYIVMPDGEIMLDGASTTPSKRAKASKLMQVIEDE